ncbi:MAG TPA: lysophospholipid acyltransferase family protein [Prolixibacteraceae bacterium]|nr:lysophospholipid acyltransferase family protein [Prolixibacteraceae bacterium]
MGLKARHHFFIYPFFKWYAGWIILRHFGRVELKNDFDDRDLPILLLANHVSWWDGFFAMFLNVNILRRKFHFMMLEEQLKRFSFFNRTGGYSIRKRSRETVESINYTAELLRKRGNMVLVFPQGKIESIYKTTFQFESGINHIIKKASCNIHILFMANLIDYFSNRKPGLYIYVSEYKSDKFDAKSIQDAYNYFYSHCIEDNALKAEL